MHFSFYGLRENPFQLTPDPQFFFGSSVHNRVKAYLTYGISQGEGFIVVTGEVGAGKTTLIAHLLSMLDPREFRTARIVTTRVGAEDVLRMVAVAFDLPVREDAPKSELLQGLARFLAERQGAGERCLLIVDEVQNMPVEALEELRMLSNLSADGPSPLQTLLVGQPQFKVTLGAPDLEQLKQRIVVSAHLAPLAEHEVRDYVLYRLTTAGWSGAPALEEDVFPAIFAESGGIPRRINLLCSRLLMLGDMDSLATLSGEHVNEVAEELRAEAAEITAEAPSALAVPPGLLTVSQDLEDRVQALEDRLRRHDRVFRQGTAVLQTLLDALEDARR